MLGKLLKYEIPAMGRKMLPLYAAWAVTALFLGLSTQAAESKSEFIVVLTGLLYTVVTTAIVVMTVILIVQRYSNSLLGDEAYFNHVLPVSAAEHIGNKLISAIVSLSGGQIFIAMVLTMLTCIVLGMGVPTTANYVIMATTCAPILIRMGMATLSAHMFVFYFGIVADITPPVALAAYAGSAIAKSKPMKTAINASMLAIAAFIVPYCFGLNPALLFVDCTVLQAIQATVTALIGVFGVAAGLRGYVFSNLRVWQRLALIVGGLTLVYPGTLTDIIGIVLVALICVISKAAGKKNHPDVPAEAA